MVISGHAAQVIAIEEKEQREASSNALNEFVTWFSQCFEIAERVMSGVSSTRRGSPSSFENKPTEWSK